MENGFYQSLARWSEIVGGIAFLVAAYALFVRFMLPMVRKAEAARNAELVNAERHREQLRAEASRVRAELEEANREAALVRERGAADGERERRRIVEEARHEGNRLLQNAQGELERSRIAARDRLRIEFIEKALLRARGLAAERVDDRLNAQLVARTVDQLASGDR